jgi:hypothetical protein
MRHIRNLFKGPLKIVIVHSESPTRFLIGKLLSVHIGALISFLTHDGFIIFDLLNACNMLETPTSDALSHFFSLVKHLFDLLKMVI